MFRLWRPLRKARRSDWWRKPTGREFCVAQNSALAKAPSTVTSIRSPGLLFAGLAENNPEYIELWRQLNSDPTDQEIIRNFPIRQPLLWVGESNGLERTLYFAAFFAFAQRAFCAAAILARASGESRRFFRRETRVLFPGRPSFPASNARASSSL